MERSSSESPKISVIIPVHNGAANISDCLSALLKSTFKDFEVIVVNDGSRDATEDLVKTFPVRLLSLPQSIGAAGARNYGAEKARGRFLFFTDSDITIQPDTLQKIYSVLTSDKGYHAVIGSYTKQTPIKSFFPVFKNYCHHFTHQKSLEEALTFWTGCGAIGRDIFLKQKGFAESYTSASIEDIEFGYRLSKQGYCIRLEKSIQVTHLKHYTFLSLIRSDVLNRAVPWTRLMLQSHTFQSDLNTTLANAISVFTVQLIPPTILFSSWYPELSFVVFVQMYLFVLCNLDFYQFVMDNDRFTFTLKTVAMSFVYFYYSGLGLILGFLSFMKDFFRS